MEGRVNVWVHVAPAGISPIERMAGQADRSDGTVSIRVSSDPELYRLQGGQCCRSMVDRPAVA